MADPILRAEGLRKYYESSAGFIESLLDRSQEVKAVDGVDLELYEGETLGVVGESGCGKTTLGRAILRLVEPTDGRVYYRQPVGRGEADGPDGRREVEVTGLSSSRLRDLRTDLQYIFQDPFASLNPRLTVGDIIGEPLDIHDIAAGEERTERVYELLETVGLNPSYTERYPHEFSGGQRQRIGIARALAVDPDVIICDEPVSALDVSVQAQILNLLEDLQDEFGLSYIFIAHDLSVVEHVSDRIAVMYLGELAEVGPARDVFEPPYHPYTEALLSAIPEPDPAWESEEIFLPGAVPSPLNPPSGCRFHTRCPAVIQPADVDVAQPVWRSLMSLKIRARDADSVAAVTAVSTEEAGVALEAEPGTEPGAAGRTDPEAASRAELDELVRAEFDLPERIADPDAEEAVSEAIDRLHDGDVAGASERLEATVRSPCEARDPELFDVGPDHGIACLLYDEEVADGRDAAGRGGDADAAADD